MKTTMKARLSIYPIVLRTFGMSLSGQHVMAEQAKQSPEHDSPEWTEFKLDNCILNLRSDRDIEWYFFHGDGSVSATIGKTKSYRTSPLCEWRINGRWLQILDGGKLWFQKRLLKISEKEISVEDGAGETQIFDIQEEGKTAPGMENSPTLTRLSFPVIAHNGSIEIQEIPVKLTSRGPNAITEALSAPVFLVSASEAERDRDIGLISRMRIRLSIQPLKRNEPFKPGDESNLKIDLSMFGKPRDVRMEIYDLVQVILACLRIDYPASQNGKINVQIVGTSDQSMFTALEGPLWRTGNSNPEK
jgi:hypothetical protein